MKTFDYLNRPDEFYKETQKSTFIFMGVGIVACVFVGLVLIPSALIPIWFSLLATVASASPLAFHLVRSVHRADAICCEVDEQFAKDLTEWLGIDINTSKANDVRTIPRVTFPIEGGKVEVVRRGTEVTSRRFLEEVDVA